MNPFTIMSAINATIELAKGLRNVFQKESRSDDDLKRKPPGDLGNVISELAAQRAQMDRLGDQVRANKDMLEKLNEVIVRLGENCEQLALLGREQRKRTALAVTAALLGLAIGLVALFLALSPG